jgi:hypothetical protein
LYNAESTLSGRKEVEDFLVEEVEMMLAMSVERLDTLLVIADREDEGMPIKITLHMQTIYFLSHNLSN